MPHLREDSACHLDCAGALSLAEQLWAPLLGRADRITHCADLMYEVALTYFNLQRWERSLSLLRELSASELYQEATAMRIGECLIALGRSTESVDVSALALTPNPLGGIPARGRACGRACDCACARACGRAHARDCE